MSTRRVTALAASFVCSVLNTKCPVSGDDVDKEVTETYKGRTIAFCCKDCVKDFNKDPKKYVKKIEEAEAKESKK